MYPARNRTYVSSSTRSRLRMDRPEEPNLPIIKNDDASLYGWIETETKFWVNTFREDDRVRFKLQHREAVLGGRALPLLTQSPLPTSSAHSL